MTTIDNMAIDNIRRVPAEWEEYSSVMIAWPHANTDWAYMLNEVEECYASLAHAIVQECKLRLLVVTPDVAHVKKLLQDLPQEYIIYFEVPTNDTWTRDYGPIALETAKGIAAVDFKFNGWGLKFASVLDNMVNLRMLEAGLLTRNYLPQLSYVFEGGALETDGNGTMLTTAKCVLSLNRNGFVSAEEVKGHFKSVLGMETVHILEHGHLEGDDTDSHIDTLARFAPGNTILYVKSYMPGDAHTHDLELMENELKQLRTCDGNPYNLIALPLPRPIHDEDGNRLPATYANFLITPTAVLLPTYRQPDNDELAIQMLKVAFPEHRIIGIDCTALIKQHGALHCSTMQLYEGMLNI